MHDGCLFHSVFAMIYTCERGSDKRWWLAKVVTRIIFFASYASLLGLLVVVRQAAIFQTAERSSCLKVVLVRTIGFL